MHVCGKHKMQIRKTTQIVIHGLLLAFFNVITCQSIKCLVVYG